MRQCLHSVLGSLALLAIVLSTGAVLQAAPYTRVLISSASADELNGVLTVSGENFGTVKPTVLLAGVELTVTNSSPTEIVAQLPAYITPGDYLISVSRNGG